MIFNSTAFLFVFLPLVLIVAFPLPRRAQNLFLLTASVVFYIWGAGWQVVWIAGVAVASYLMARMMHSNRWTSSRAFFTLSLIVALSPLALLKYLSPMSLWWSESPILALALPLGISFFTFHAVSYLIDVKRGSVSPEKNANDYFLYLFYFPHQIAGPIVRYSEIVDDIKHRPRPSRHDVVIGFSRFGWGLAKKSLIADPAGVIATQMWAIAASPEPVSFSLAWLGAFAFAVQIYFDFSAYSDMAIGLARIFGFHFPENFAAPYASISATEFWRRWHMTLSRWFRDYVYIPLGGSRHGVAREYIALLVTFALTSLWHGATSTFILWGVLWSSALVVERLTGLNKSARFAIFRRAAMALFIVFSWVPFRAPSLSGTAEVWRAMVVPNSFDLSPMILVVLSPLNLAALLIGLAYMFWPRKWAARVFGATTGLARTDNAPLLRVGVIGLVAGVVGISVSFLNTSTPFIYFQF